MHHRQSFVVLFFFCGWFVSIGSGIGPMFFSATSFRCLKGLCFGCLWHWHFFAQGEKHRSQQRGNEPVYYNIIVKQHTIQLDKLNVKVVVLVQQQLFWREGQVVSLLVRGSFSTCPMMTWQRPLFTVLAVVTPSGECWLVEAGWFTYWKTWKISSVCLTKDTNNKVLLNSNVDIIQN